ncbi:MAG: hypothetical protein AAF423_07840 [Pseudomonadota bacterium]
MNVQSTGDKARLTLSADEARDLIRMLALAPYVDEAIVDSNAQQIEAFQALFAQAVQRNSDNIIIETPKKDITKLSMIIEGVNVVDPDDFFTGKGLDLVSDERMEELSDAMHEMSNQLMDPELLAAIRKAYKERYT